MSRPQAPKARRVDLSALRVKSHDVVKCPTGTLGYSRSVATTRTKNNPAARMVECLKCDAWHVEER